MIFIQKQTHKSLEQNRKPRNKSMYTQIINVQQSSQDYITGNILQENDSLINK